MSGEGGVEESFETDRYPGTSTPMVAVMTDLNSWFGVLTAS